MCESRRWETNRSHSYLVRGYGSYFAEARVCCLRDYCGYGCCRCVGRNFYDGQRKTTSVCSDDGENAFVAAIDGRPHHYRPVGLLLGGG